MAKGRLAGRVLPAPHGAAALGQDVEASARTRPAAVGGQSFEGLGPGQESSNEEGASSELGDAEAEDLRQMRERLSRQFEQIAVDGGSRAEDEEDPLWARPEDMLSSTGLPRPGTVLVAHPESYFEGLGQDVDEEGFGPVPTAALRTHRMPQREGASRRERADLPVVLLTKKSPQGTEGLMLGCWTGRLLGDLDFDQFMTRPLYLGGIAKQNLCFLHAYPELKGSFRLTPDGLAISNHEAFMEACNFIENDVGSPWRFKFFLNRVMWKPEEESELLAESGVWIPVRCSRDLLLREPDSAYEEPLWVQIAEKVGGKLADLARKFGLFVK